MKRFRFPSAGSVGSRAPISGFVTRVSIFRLARAASGPRNPLPGLTSDRPDFRMPPHLSMGRGRNCGGGAAPHCWYSSPASGRGPLLAGFRPSDENLKASGSLRDPGDTRSSAGLGTTVRSASVRPDTSGPMGSWFLVRSASHEPRVDFSRPLERGPAGERVLNSETGNFC